MTVAIYSCARDRQQLGSFLVTFLKPSWTFLDCGLFAGTFLGRFLDRLQQHQFIGFWACVSSYVSSPCFGGLPKAYKRPGSPGHQN